MSDSVEMFAAGACKGNPAPSGWCALLVFQCLEKELSGGEPNTTNNFMELTVAILVLKEIKRLCKLLQVTGSQYVMKSITEWLINWKKSDSKTAAKEALKNTYFWKFLDEQVSLHNVNWHWVHGYYGHERADQLANRGVYEVIGGKHA